MQNRKEKNSVVYFLSSEFIILLFLIWFVIFLLRASIKFRLLVAFFIGNITIKVFWFLFVVIVCLLLVVPQHLFLLSASPTSFQFMMFFSLIVSLSLSLLLRSCYLFALIFIRTVIKSNKRHESKFSKKQKRHNRETKKICTNKDSCNKRISEHTSSDIDNSAMNVDFTF